MSIEDMTLKELGNIMAFAGTMGEACTKHMLVILIDPDHECSMRDELTDEELATMPKIKDGDVRSFLAYEQAALDTFAMMRMALQAQGYDVRNGAEL